MNGKEKKGGRIKGYRRYPSPSFCSCPFLNNVVLNPLAKPREAGIRSGESGELQPRTQGRQEGVYYQERGAAQCKESERQQGEAASKWEGGWWKG